MTNLDAPIERWEPTEHGWLQHFTDTDAAGWQRDFTAYVYERADGRFSGLITNAEHEPALSTETVGAWSTPEGAADALRRMWREG